jgi:hypothetical protein
MANVAVQGRPVEDPWLTWSVPEFGPGYWQLPPEENYPGLAEQSIPELVGNPGTHDQQVPTYGHHPQSTGYGGVGWGDDDLDDLDELLEDTADVAGMFAGVDADVIDTIKDAEQWGGPPRDVGFYGPAATWGAADGPTFAQTMVGWGMLAYDPVQQRHRPTLKLGYTVFFAGLVGSFVLSGAGRRN